jgi:hypothetical protein
MTQQAVNYDAVLATGSKQKMKRPPIVLAYGEKKIGKTTFGAAFPKPVFLCGEDGAHAIADHRYPSEGQIASWAENLNYTRAIAYGKHEHQTLVADTAGPLASLCLDHTVKLSDKPTWEKMGWGKEEDLIREWRVWLSLLEHCRNKRNMTVVILAHAIQAGVQDSQLGEKYYVWQGDMQRSVWNFTSNWADIVLYAAKERSLLGLGDDERTRAMVKDTHWAYSAQTSEHFGFEAGVRGGYWLPSKFKLDYKVFAESIADTPVAVRARILELAKPYGDGFFKATQELIAKQGDSMGQLRALELDVQSRIAAVAQPKAAT